jgi:hypothetical protein
MVRIAFFVFTVVILVLTGCQKPMPEAQRLANSRPAEINLERVKDWSLSVNGVPFERSHHKLVAGQNVPLIGHLNAKEGAIRPSTIPELRIAFRPAGKATSKDWSIPGGKKLRPEYYWEIWAPIIQGKVVHDPLLRPEHFAPGEYEARLYFRVFDWHLGKSTADLLATSTITISAN